MLGAERQPGEIVLTLAAESAADEVSIRIRREDGGSKSYSVALASLPEQDSAEFDGRRLVRKLITLPADLPLGYHEVEVSCGTEHASMRLILAPDRAYLPPDLRAAGVAVSLYGVRSRLNWGCGDFRDLCDLIDWIAAETGASFVALNPLHAIHNRRPFNTSPYLPNSVFFQNFLYLDVESVPDFQASRRARRLWAKADVQQEIIALRESEFVEYERVAALKLRLTLPFGGSLLAVARRC